MLLLLALLLAQRPDALPTDPDGDRDGLSDFQEVHKYFTDPRKADTDGDGVPDGDWEERREHAYTVRVVMHVLPPVDVTTLCDDYQDVRVSDARADAVEIEAIVYPYNTNAEALADVADEKLPAALKPFLDPGITSNWDEPMRKALVAELLEQGVDVRKTKPVELVPRAAKWLMDRSAFEDSFTTFDVVAKDGKLVVHEKLVATVDRELAKVGRTLDEQLQRELYGRGMFASKVHGSCTSCAIYLQTGLRALGIPTRTILCTPAVDANDEREVAWIDARIEHDGVRKTLRRAARAQKGSWTSHTFNEVWIGGRWRRLNYAKLGQNVLDPGGLGLMVHVNTWREHAEAGLASMGLHSAFTPEDGLFAGPNPYSCVSLSDRFGAHCKLANPPDDSVRAVTIASAYWSGDARVRDAVTVKLRDGDDGAGHVLLRAVERDEGEGIERFSDFFQHVPKDFLLRARDEGEVRATSSRGYWLRGAGTDFYLRIAPEELAKMPEGVAFELVPPATEDGYGWIVQPGVTIAR